MINLSDLQWTFSLDADRDGVYETDITPYVNLLAGGGFNVNRGIGPDGVYQASQMTLYLDNNTGLFTVDNPASPLHGKVTPHMPVQVSMTYAAVTYSVWTGYIKGWEFQYDLTPRGATVKANCADIASYLAEYAPVDLLVSTTRTAGDIIRDVLGLMGLNSTEWVVDDGLTTFEYTWAVNQTALNAIMDGVRSEMGGWFWVDADGKPHFENRERRLGIAVYDTWGDGTAIVPVHATYSWNWLDVYTSVMVQANILQSHQANIPVFAFSRSMNNKPPNSMLLGAGQQYTADFNYGSAIIEGGLVAPVPYIDYRANSAIDGGGTDHTNDLIVTATDKGAGFRLVLKNPTGSAFYITQFGMRGQTAQWQADKPQFAVVDTVPWAPAGKGLQVSLAWTDDTGGHAADYAYELLRTFRLPYPTLSLQFVLETSPGMVASLMGVEIGDRVRYVDKARAGAMGVDDWWYVENISVNATPGKATSVITTLIPTSTYRRLSDIVYDVFDRPDAGGALGRSTQGATWANDSGMDIASGLAVTNTGAAQTPNVALTHTDMDVEVSWEDGQLGDRVGVVYRYVDANNYWRAYWDGPTQTLKLDKVVAGVVTNVG